MKLKTFYFFLAALLVAVLLTNCSPRAVNQPNQEEQDTDESTGFDWRNPEIANIIKEEAFFSRQIGLVEPALCLEEMTLLEVRSPKEGWMTMLFESASGKIPPGKYVAFLEDLPASDLFICDLVEGADHQLSCSGPSVPPGTQTTVRFGALSSDQLTGLMAGDGDDMYELLASKSTGLDIELDFLAVEETAGYLGMQAPVNLLDAYRVIGSYAGLAGFLGAEQINSAKQLMSVYPQYQKNGLICDSYWECAKLCAAEINYDFTPDDLVGAFEFYSKFASRLGKLLPESCQAMNQYAEVIPARPGSRQYLDQQWQLLSFSRFNVYNPQLDLFEIYDVRDHWTVRDFDLTPQDVYSCAEAIGYPYETIYVDEFLNRYFNTLLSLSYEYPSSCVSEETRAWIQSVTEDLSENPSTNSGNVGDKIDACASAMGYSNSLSILADSLEFMEWLMEIWASGAENIPSECSEMWASSETTNLFALAEYYLENDIPRCSTEQQSAINDAISQFRYENGLCEDDGSCQYYDPTCQELAFANSLLRDGIIDGPSTCSVKLPPSCLAYANEDPYVPPEVWECALDSCFSNVYPLQRGEGVNGFAWQIKSYLDTDPNGFPPSCRTPEVMYWVDYNYECASENYGDSNYEYYQCGASYPDPTSECYYVNYGGGNWQYWCSDSGSGSQNCPSCSTVFECAEGEEGGFCGEPPEEDDPGYWGQLNQCGDQISWGEEVRTYQDAADLVRYIVAAAPFLQVEDIPTSCKLAVNQTMVPGLNYGDFLTGITLGGTVEGSSVCSQSVEITIPDEPLVEEYDRCFTFSQKQYGLTLLDIPAGSSALTTYVSMSGGVPGLEVDIPEDSNPWEYSAVLGEVQAANCNFPGYAERLYCAFGLPANYMYSLQPLSVYVNGCEAPIFSHPAVSIIPEEAESTGGGGSSDSCVKPPHPDPQNGCWIWIEEECKWECYN